MQNTKYELFHKIATACAGLNVQLAIALAGEMAAETMTELPSSPLVVKSASQLNLLSRASLIITHGGLNTILDSLSQGVPLVTIPITSNLAMAHAFNGQVRRKLCRSSN